MTNNTDLTVGQIITRKTVLGYSTGPVLATEKVEVTEIGDKMATGRIIDSPAESSIGKTAGIYLTASERSESDARMEAQAL